ncbi:AbrB family transcriptional regulator [Staphylococcus auricularis]|uniref:AbrB family transcriptional regulator n=1 Tax=Staphylococcus auricularis TaxID=29379 RepID=UPI00242FB52D|nr:AbrB family transcriptional regulator [Staphylococcus auricularis]
MKKHLWLNNSLLFLIAVAISLTLHFLHVLLPFMFGPIIAGILCVRVLKLEVKWPSWIKLLGMILLGVQIGTTFTKSVIGDIKDDWLFIVLITVLLIVLSLLIATLFKRIARVNFQTAMLSVIPGALSQMLLMAEEDKRANLMIVSLTQTSRIIFVVILIPLISFLYSSPKEQSSTGAFVQAPLTEVLSLHHVVIIGVFIALVYVLMKKIHFPTKELLAPIIVLIGWNLTTNMTFALDNYIIAAAQVLYMISIGVQIAHLLDQMKGRIAVAITLQNVLLILVTFIMVNIISYFSNHDINNLFLSAAPGGVNQIVLVAMETGGDVAMISSYHIFRIFFILFIIAPLIQFILNKMAAQRR